MYSEKETVKKPTYLFTQTAYPFGISQFSSSLHISEYTVQGLVELLRSVARLSIVTLTFYVLHQRTIINLYDSIHKIVLVNGLCLLYVFFTKLRKTITRI